MDYDEAVEAYIQEKQKYMALSGVQLLMKSFGLDPALIESKLGEAQKLVLDFTIHIDDRFARVEALLNSQAESLERIALGVDRVQELILDPEPAAMHDISALVELGPVPVDPSQLLIGGQHG